MIEFKSLASSSAGNAYTVSDGTTVLGIECGLAFRQLQRALNFQVSSLAGVLVSHSHADHCKSAKEVMRAGVDVYALPETFEAIGGAGHRAKPVEPRVVFQVGTWSVLPFALVHDVPNTGFLLTNAKGEGCVYLTDTAYCPVRFPPVQVFAIEANYSLAILRSRLEAGALDPAQFQRTVRSHLSLERAVELLEANDLTQVREVHLLHLSDGNSNEAAFKTTVQRATGKPVYVAKARGEQHAPTTHT